MPSSIEFKALIQDFGAASEIARALSGAPPQIVTQEDVFFRCGNGRLKLRILGERAIGLCERDFGVGRLDN